VSIRSPTPNAVSAEISFGNFLINRMVEELRREMSEAGEFFDAVACLRLHAVAEAGGRCSVFRRGRALLAHLDEPDWFDNAVRTGAAIAIGAEAAGRALFPESAHLKRAG